VVGGAVEDEQAFREQQDAVGAREQRILGRSAHEHPQAVGAHEAPEQGEERVHRRGVED